jgi:hypothetical protein
MEVDASRHFMEMSLFPLSMFYFQCVDFVCVYSLMRFLSLSFLEICIVLSLYFHGRFKNIFFGIPRKKGSRYEIQERVWLSSSQLNSPDFRYEHFFMSPRLSLVAYRP